MAVFTPLRNTQEKVDLTPIADGQILFTTDTNRIYIDGITNRTLYRGNYDIDDILSTTSTNPVQNKVVTSNIDSLQSQINSISLDTVKLSSENTTDNSIGFGIDANGNWGYIKAGADTVTPFKRNLTRELVATRNYWSGATSLTLSADVSSNPYYKTFTSDNFFVTYGATNLYTHGFNVANLGTLKPTYNSTTGIASITVSFTEVSATTGSFAFYLYLIYA